MTIEGSKDQDFALAQAAIHQTSVPVPVDSRAVLGCDISKLCDTLVPDGKDRLSQIMDAFRTSGFQATTLAQAIEQVNLMLAWKPEVVDEADRDPSREFCKIFLGYTSNMVSCGNREVIRWLVQNKMVHVLVTTAGGIEEDFIKCLKPTLLGDFKLDGKTLRSQGLNRIGNLLMPNENYCVFEDWLDPILDTMVKEQNETGKVWSPSSMIDRLGKEINNEESIYYWAHRNGIPVFCPAITDGSIGDMIYFHSYKQDEGKQLVLDLVQDIRKLNNEAIRSGATGILCLGGGVVKHHICNANLMRNGAEFAVFINTGHEFDGSDSGASPDEAVSWGKIKTTATPVKVSCEASIAFPLLVAESFAKESTNARRANQQKISDSLYI